MSTREDVLTFGCEGEQLMGILTSPVAAGLDSGIGVLIVVGGPQYRIGSHRQFVTLARTLASEGHHCLRFDYRGMGDSTGAVRDFSQVSADIGAAIDALRARCPGVSKVALWGLCDAASAVLLYVHEAGRQAKVDAICLLNPWVRSAHTQARTQVKHYYWQRLRQPSFWLKLAKGGVAAQALRGLLQNLQLSRRSSPSVASDTSSLPFQEAMAQACLRFEGPQLLILSGDDYTAKEFIEAASMSPDWQTALSRPTLQRIDLPGVDHTFSNTRARTQVLTATSNWLGTLA